MKKLCLAFAGAAIALLTIRCNPKTESLTMTDSLQTRIKVTAFGKMPDGRDVSQYTLSNSSGMTMKVINYGGIVTSLTAPDRDGNLEDVTLGYDSLSHYLRNNPYFGALIGRYGNRIAKGKFTLDGQEYTLAQNNDGNHLHGGPNGFDKVFWNIEEHFTEEGPALKLRYESKDMEEGYPGNLRVEVIYILTDKNEWKIKYRATTDKKTIVNLTQHTYFNLSGNTKTDILGHELYIDADKFLPVDKTLIPTGELVPVSGTPFEFTTPTAIGSRINDGHEQLEYGGGYDHCWALTHPGDTLKAAVTLHDPATGRVMSVYTTEPGIQFYSGNFLDGSNVGKLNTVYAHRFGLCLETQHFPDSPNREKFPPVELAPGQVYSTETVYTFTTK